MNESQLSDVSHPTTLISVKGFLLNPATFGSVFMMHSMAESGAMVQAIGESQNISGIWHDDPQVYGYVAGPGSILSVLTGSSMIHHSNAGIDSFGPTVGPISASRIAAAAGGALRTTQTDSGATDGTNLSATSMRDQDGTDYFGPGGISAPFDLKVGRIAARKWGVGAPIDPPTNFAGAAAGGGSLANGVYYLKIATGDELNPPATVSAASAEIGPFTCGGGNNKLNLTWTPNPANTTGKVTLYITNPGGGPGNEVKAVNVSDTGSNTLSVFPSANLTPLTVGDLFSTAFTFDGSSDINNGGVTFTTDDAHTPGTGITNAVAYLKIISNGHTYYIPLAQ
jgi:hypothetical protein